MRELLKQPRHRRPTAVYCTNDVLVFGSMQAIIEKGLKIPDDISIMGTDDVAQSSHMYPPVTTIAQPFGEIAKAAMAQLLNIEEKAEDDILLQPELKIRKSTGPAPQK